jgi:hypothetical protein
MEPGMAIETAKKAHFAIEQSLSQVQFMMISVFGREED